MSTATKLSAVSTARRDVLQPYIPQHLISFDFNPFAGLGREFVIAIARTFAVRAGAVAKGTAKRDYYALKILLSWIQTNRQSFPAFRHKLLVNYKSIEVDEWESIFSTWRNQLIHGEQERKGSTQAQLIRAINVHIEAWINAGVIKPVTRLVPVKHSNKLAKHKKCLGEIPATSVLPDAATLATLNKERLRDLRKCAEQEFKTWSDHFQEGERLLHACDMSFSEIRRIIHTEYRNLAYRAWALRRLLPKGSLDISLPRYLLYVLNEYGGLIPYDRKSRAGRFHITFCRLRRLKREDLQAYLLPHIRVANAVQILFMIDTGANVSVCHSLDRDCLSDSDVAQHKSITGFKDRAKGKRIVTELPVNDPQHEISCVRAVEAFLRMSKRLKDLAPKPFKNRLFLHPYRNRRVAPIDTSVSNNHFKSFLSRHEELSGLDLTADMIRPTIIFQTTYQNGGDLSAANVLSDHSTLSTTAGYTDKQSLRVTYEELTREFQSLFQATAISNIEGAPQALDISASKFKQRLSKARRTGLGIACLNPKSGYQPGTAKGKNCDAFQNCPRCPFRFVIATVPNVTDLIIFREHLRISRAEFEATRPKRWLKVWLPWLIFAEVALERIQRGPTAAVFLRAKAVADSRMRSESVNFPPLS